jgi:hypothetical protein
MLQSRRVDITYANVSIWFGPGRSSVTAFPPCFLSWIARIGSYGGGVEPREYHLGVVDVPSLSTW